MSTICLSPECELRDEEGVVFGVGVGDHGLRSVFVSLPAMEAITGTWPTADSVRRIATTQIGIIQEVAAAKLRRQPGCVPRGMLLVMAADLGAVRLEPGGRR